MGKPRDIGMLDINNLKRLLRAAEIGVTGRWNIAELGNSPGMATTSSQWGPRGNLMR
jgi:hypothetical protein